jgi:RecG-like helicase
MMSATPIPRTLSQIIHSDVSVSTLLAFPHGQRNVKTGVVRSTDPIIDQAVKKAIAAHRQVFVVAPKIEEGTKKNSLLLLLPYSRISLNDTERTRFSFFMEE